jgi:ATPase subunit of ABC transporter with duplicated ATPase domains
VKHFDLELTRGNPATSRRIETRFLVKTDAGVYGLTYRWNDAQTDANLVAEDGLTKTIVNGSGKMQSWYFPKRNDCLECHNETVGYSLGLQTAQLDRTFAYPSGTTANQLNTLEHIGLTTRRDVAAGVLTYAEQRALEIGITIAGGAAVILLDEPTAGMSRGEADQAVALIRRVSEGRTLLIVEHDMSVVFGLADRISVLVYGEIIATDAPAAIRDNAAVQAAYLGALPDA